jgi:glycosyltransferase involved in cell wall biosynthesis
MKIFVSGLPLVAFTSGTPMRGLLTKLISIRYDDTFHIYISNVEECNSYFSQIATKHNVFIYVVNEKNTIQNLRKLIGIKLNKSPKGFDFYISPGMPEYFSFNQQPSLSVIADLSSINLPGQSSLKWHGNRIFKNTLNWALASNTRIATISEFTRKELKAYCPSQSHKYFTLHNGIEEFWFDNNYEESEISDMLRNDSYWIWWGYISNRKNINNLITAYIEAKKSDISLPKIVFIGQYAPDQSSCIDLIKNYPEYFQLFDFQPNYVLKTIVKNSKGLLFPSLYEGFGLPVIEAFSQGVPVLLSNVTSLPEISNGLGIEINPYQKDSIVDGLIRLNQLPKNTEDIIARQKWASNFTYIKAAKKLSKIIDELTGR